MTTPDAWHLFWAKTFPREGEDRAATDRLHPLWAHLIDVANVADLLWEHRVPPALRRRMADTLGLPPADARRWLSLWIGLHDVGKAVPFFQSQHGPSWERISNTPLAQPAPDTDRMHHGYASIPILYAWIDESASSAIVPDDVKPLARSLATFAGVHHGRITTGPRTMRRGVRGWGEGQKALGWTQMSGSHPWQQAQRSLIDAVADAWLDGVSAPSEAPNPWPPFLLHVAGWVTLADWLGSNASAFDAEAVTTDPVDATTQTVKGYLSISRERAHDAVATMGAASSPVVHSSFQTLYPEYESPRPIQRRALQRSHTGKPSLTIIEAPTGEGKTEAALLQAARQQKGRGEGGIYVAMPTQATSNSIFGRIAGFVKRATGRAEIDDLALVHGGADLHPSRRSSDEGDDTEEIYDEDGPDVGQVRTRAWFLPKKRGLLSPYGIGTVDQAFLGTLHVRHFFLRLFGLAGKTVIFDEVHAYDTYMARIFEQLLRWLKAVDAHVILLSATLPGSLRDQFLEAWDAEPTVTGRDAPYPAMWHTDGGLCAPNEGNEDDDLGVDPANRRSITVRPHGMSRGAIAATVNRALDAGATVAVLCNTVARAQNVYRHLTQSGQSASRLDDHDRRLLHARLIHKERTTRETVVNERFGSSRASGRSALLVATQVAEQSLDIDVDLMLTDLAPIDLLLQRAGRLQRHQDEHRGERPQGYDEAMLHVMMPRVSADRLPNLKETPLGYETVYMPAPMLRTWNELRNGTVWTLPDDYREVVESVYGDDADPPVRLQKEDRQRWREAMMERKDSERDDRRTAVSRLISRPSQLYNLFQVDEPERIEDDDPSVHRSLRAPTRLADLPSIETVVLHQQEEDESYYLDRTCEREAPICDLDAMENRRLLQEHTVRVTHSTIPGLLNDVADEHAALLKQFEEAPAFRYHRPLVFTDGVWERNGARMRFDDRLGLVIEAHGS